MSEARWQPGRFLAEKEYGAPTPANVVNQRYRLQPAHLPLGRVVTVVRAVTVQGLDAATPVLHGEHLPQPLVLDQANVAALTQLAGSPLFADWVGCTVALRVVRKGGVQRIQLEAPNTVPPTRRAPTIVVRKPSMISILALLLLALTALALAAYLGGLWPPAGIAMP